VIGTSGGESNEENQNENAEEIKLEEWLRNKEFNQGDVLIEDEKKGSRLVPAKAAMVLNSLFKFYSDKRSDELFIYHEDTGTWQPDGEKIVSKFLEARIGYITSTKSISETIGHIKRGGYIDPSTLTVKNTLINLRNGVLDLETGQLLPHSPDYYFTNYLDLEWKQNPEVPKKIIEFLADRAGGDDEKFISLLESAAFPLLPDYRIHTAVMLVGPTHRGKTTFLELLERIYGKENAAHISIQQLSLSTKDRPFMLTSLINKTINVADDLPDKPIEYTGLFKQLTGESPIQAERKFGGMISFYNRAKMFFSANKIPVAYETSDAFYGRWQIIEFTRPIQNEKPQEIFMQELANEEELNNFLPLLVWIAKNKLMKSTKFTFSKTPEQNATVYAKHSNTAQLYCETRLNVNQHGSILKANIFNDYKQWCEKHDYIPETEKAFWITLRSFFADKEYVVERRKTINGVTNRFYDGLEFVDESEDEEEKNEENTPGKDKDLLKDYFCIKEEQSLEGCQDCQDCQDFGIFNYVKNIYTYYKEIKKNLVNVVNLDNSMQPSNNLLDTQPQPSPEPQPPPAPQVHDPSNTPTNPNKSDNILSSPSHLNAQAQEPGPIALPGPVLDSLQKEREAMLMVDKPMQQEAPAEPHEQAPSLSKEEIVQRVYLAVKLAERDNEAFWSDPDLGEPNKKLYPALQGLTTYLIQEALKTLQWQGYIVETKPGYWHAVKDLHLVDILAYDNPDMPVYCPNCMKPVTRLYWYDGEWLCIDCLNARQHQNDDLYV